MINLVNKLFGLLVGKSFGCLFFDYFQHWYDDDDVDHFTFDWTNRRGWAVTILRVYPDHVEWDFSGVKDILAHPKIYFS
jgi:hypothetical protein